MSTKNSSTHTKKYKEILTAVHMVYRLVNSTYNIQELSLRLARLLCAFIKADSATVLILDQNKTKVNLLANFDNKINTLVTKKKDLQNVPEKEMKVARGYIVREKHLLGIPLVADDNIGAILLRRKRTQPSFTEYDKDFLSVVAEQSVTAIKNLQLNDEQQKIILGSIEFIGKLLKKQDHSQTATHTPAFFKMVKALAIKLGMGESGINSLYYASVLHDAGAIDVPYDILSKSSKLTKEEFKVIRNHPTRSVELIKPVEFLKPVLPIILYHHEKYDGTGYPSGLKKEQIPLGARIMAVVDAFEAMRSERPYKKKLSIDESINELKANSGSQFDPNVVNAFVNLSRQKKYRNYLSSIN